MKYFLVAGERSGDLHASHLIEQILTLDKEAQIHGWGGSLMRAAGANITQDYSAFNFMGFWEVAKHISTIYSKLRQCSVELQSFQPDVLVLIDFPGFNLRLARDAQRHGIKVCYYISPKIWAWRKSRINAIRKSVDRMLVIFPFEVSFYQSLNYEVHYVGNPVLDSINKKVLDRGFQAKYQQRRVISFLPGSRAQEVVKAIEVIQRLVVVFEEYHFLISAVDNLDSKFYDSLQGIPNVEVVYGHVYDVLSVSEAAVITSGTATLEAALLGIPQVVVYKTSTLTYLMAKWLMKVPYISLVNLILGRSVVRELIQGEYDAANIASALEDLLSDEGVKKRISEGYSEIHKIIGDESASKNAAKAVIALGSS